MEEFFITLFSSFMLWSVNPWDFPFGFSVVKQDAGKVYNKIVLHKLAICS